MSANSIVAIDAEPTVYVVDDDPSFRKSLRWLIESVGLKVATYGSGREFLENCRFETPGCVVLDVRMQGMSGLELQEKLQERNVDLPVIMVTAYGDVPMAVRAMKSGAVDFFEKPFSDQVLLDHIQQAIQNNVRSKQDRAEHIRIKALIGQLTPREREVMDLVVNGLSSKQIAAELNVSFKTIEAHRAKIMKKMQAKSVPNLIRMNLAAHNMCPPPGP